MKEIIKNIAIGCLAIIDLIIIISVINYFINSLNLQAIKVVIIILIISIGCCFVGKVVQEISTIIGDIKSKGGVK